MKTKIKNSFPIEVFPEEIQKVIKEISLTNSISTDIVGLFLLSAVGFALSHKYEVQVKDFWVERSNLFVIFIGISGTGKSPIFNAIYAPIKKLDAKLLKDYKRNYSKYLTYKTALKKGGDLYGERDKDVIMAWCEREFGEANIPQIEPVQIEPIVENITFEKLFKTLSNKGNDGRPLIIKYDEFGGFLKQLNQYRKGADEETLLKLFGYDGMKRGTLGKEGNFIVEEQTVSIAGTTQPTTMYDIITKDRVTNGHIFRYLFTADDIDYNIPDNLPNVYRNWNSTRDVYENYYSMMNDFLLDYDSKPIREVLILNDEIKNYLGNWKAEINKSLIDNNPCSISPNEFIGIYGKMDMYVQRFAIILNRMKKYFANDLNNLNFDLEDYKNSSKLVQYFAMNIYTILEDLRFSKNRYFNSVDEREFYEKLPNNFDFKLFVCEYAYHLKKSEKTGQRRLKEWTEEAGIIGKFKGQYYKK